MTKNNIKKWLVITLITPLIFTACTKDWLDDVKLEGPSVEDVYFQHLTGLSQLVTGAYATVNNVAAGLHNLDVMYVAYGSISSDESEAGGEQGGADIVDFQNWDQGNPQSSEPKAIADNNWAYNYKAIQRTNLTLKGLDQYRSAHSEPDSLAIVDQFEGEMRFLRAFVHFKLVQIYGHPPIIDHILGSSEYNRTNDSLATCLHFVQSELLKAIELLPSKSQYSAADFGRATKETAQALLAKAYLYESSYAENYAGDSRFAGCSNKYDKALAQAQAVINSNLYQLVGINGETFDTYWNQNGSPIYTSTPGFRYIFSVAGESSDEFLFSTQAVNDQGNYMTSRGTYLTIYMTCRNTSGGTLGWGFNCPTDDLLNAYDPADPRLAVTIARTGDPVYITTGWDTYNCMQSPTNMYTRKYECSPDDYWGTRSTDGNGPTNFPYIRYADVVLMAAEAAFKTGDAGTALNYVNMIRKRARNGAVTGAPADLTACTFADIVKERQLELACEGHRFFDLVRWKLASQYIAGQELQKYLGGVAQTSPVSNSFEEGINEFFPIPLTEIINSNYSLEQYPGYQ